MAEGENRSERIPPLAELCIEVPMYVPFSLALFDESRLDEIEYRACVLDTYCPECKLDSNYVTGKELSAAREGE